MLHHNYRGPRSPLMDIHGNFNARDYNIYKNDYGMNIIYNIGKKIILYTIYIYFNSIDFPNIISSQKQDHYLSTITTPKHIYSKN